MHEKKEEFGELLKYTVIGYVIAIFSGSTLDHFSFQKSGLGQWFVRTVAGEGESLFEGFYAFKSWLKGTPQTMAQAYGWGKFFGMATPWVIDGASRIAGVDIYGAAGFYIPYFYALSDQMGANVSGMFFLYKKEKSLKKTLFKYIKNPVMLSSLMIVLLVPFGLLAVRLLGFSPSTQVLAAIETIAANLCWIPPLIGWRMSRKD